MAEGSLQRKITPHKNSSQSRAVFSLCGLEIFISKRYTKIGGEIMVKRKVHFTLDCAKPGSQFTVEGLHVGDKRSCEFHILLRNGIVPLSFDDENIAVIMKSRPERLNGIREPKIPPSAAPVIQ